MEQHISFSKIYIFRFADFNGMLNENVKQNIVNSMGREDLNGCTIQDLWQTFSWTYLAIFTVKHLCWTLVLTKLETFRPATLLKWESNANVSQWILPNF